MCRFCWSLKLLRTKHCRTCGICVYRFDHHCAWASNCIGGGNHRLFFCYILSQLSLMLFFLLEVLFGFSRGPASPKLVIPVVLFFLSTLATLFVGILVKMHVGFILSDGTTYEVHRGFRIPAMKEPQDGNPYGKGSAWRNITAFLFRVKSRVEVLPTTWRAPF